MSNWQKWSLFIVLGFATGAITALTDASPSVMDVIRHGCLTLLPTLGALNVTLKKDLGVGQ